MRTGPPPLRFLTLVVGGWVAARTALLLPLASAPPPARPPPSPATRWGVATAANATLARVVPLDRFRASQAPRPRDARRSQIVSADESGSARAASKVRHSSLVGDRPVEWPPPVPPTLASAGPSLRPAAPRPSRWAGSAWVFVRDGGDAQLAAGGSLGGSQIGGRLSYRLNDDATRPFALSARFYAPTSTLRAAEAAVGLDWRPSAAAPLHLLAERRQALGRDGRSAFSLLAYGGASDRRVAGPLLADAYVQAGVVGMRSRDLFADAAVKLGVRHGDRVKFGVGAWGAAQPGAERLDIGPHVSVRLPVARVGVVLAADWRFRVAGDARPGSGPALTLATEF